MEIVADEQLSRLLDALAESIRAALADFADSPPPKALSGYQRIVPQEGGYRTENELRWIVDDNASLRLDLNVMNRADEVLAIVTSSPPLTARFLVDAANNPVLGDAQTTWLRNTLLAKFIRLYLEECDSFEWNEDAFDNASSYLKEYLARTRDVLVVTTGLSGADLVGDPLVVEPGLSIRHLSLEGKQELYDLQHSATFGPFDQFSVVNLNCVVDQEVEMGGPGAPWEAQRHAADRLNLLITALRLHGPGLVRAFKQWSYRKEPHFGMGSSSYMPIGNVLSAGPELVLESNVKVGAVLAARLAQLETIQDQALELSLRRLGYAYDRSLPEDRFLDHWIALEALFTTSGENQETVDKISRRMARLLGSSQDDRHLLKKEIKVLYNLRSRVVHGVGIAPDKVTAATARTEVLLRETLCKRLDAGWTVESLEDEMMG